MKGRQDEIKAAFERGGSSGAEGAWDSMINSDIAGKESKDTMELRTTKPDGAGEEKETGRVRIRTIRGK